MTTEQLIQKYEIAQHAKYIQGKGYEYFDAIEIHNVSLMKKDNMMEEVKERKQEIIEYLTAKREAEKRAIEERQEKINSIPGLKEIENALNDIELWQEEFSKSFDDVGGLGVRPKPIYDFDELYEKYPIAKAYLDAEKYAIKTNYELSHIGKKALERIIYHQDEYQEAIQDMEADIKAFTDKHMWD